MTRRNKNEAHTLFQWKGPKVEFSEQTVWTSSQWTSGDVENHYFPEKRNDLYELFMEVKPGWQGCPDDQLHTTVKKKGFPIRLVALQWIAKLMNSSLQINCLVLGLSNQQNSTEKVHMLIRYSFVSWYFWRGFQLGLFTRQQLRVARTRVGNTPGHAFIHQDILNNDDLQGHKTTQIVHNDHHVYTFFYQAHTFFKERCLPMENCVLLSL